jgi:preprotein translocase subunit YajC
MNPNTVQLLFFGVIIVVFVLLMVRNGRKRQRDQLALTEGLRPGAEVMTTFGVFGTIVSVDEAENKVVIRTGPNSELTIHRQAIGRVVTAPQDAEATLNGAPVLLDDAASEPEFGERVQRDAVAPQLPGETPGQDGPASAARPAARESKKSTE